jgi:hypothetical protein
MKNILGFRFWTFLKMSNFYFSKKLLEKYCYLKKHRNNEDKNDTINDVKNK